MDDKAPDLRNRVLPPDDDERRRILAVELDEKIAKILERAIAKPVKKMRRPGET